MGKDITQEYNDYFKTNERIDLPSVVFRRLAKFFDETYDYQQRIFNNRLEQVNKERSNEHRTF